MVAVRRVGAWAKRGLTGVEPGPASKLVRPAVLIENRHGKVV